MTWKAFIFYGDVDDLMSFAYNTLRPLIRRFDDENWIKGFNFSFYSGKGEGVHLSVRLDVRGKHKKEVEKELNELPIKPEISEYDERDKIAKYYELGSRWAFLLQDQIDKRRFQKKWIKEDNFILAVHGLCNSLFFGYYEEIRFHLKSIVMIALTMNKLEEVKSDLNTINQKCRQWFLKPKRK